ncbi:MAG: SAM-dependent methyltransferase [Planctomycetota bacterium]
MNEDELLADILGGLVQAGQVEHGPRVEAAFRMAARAHATQQRNDGSPYLIHPARVARALLEEWRHAEVDLLVAALLHDAVEDSELTLDEVEAAFGPGVRLLVDHLTKPACAPEDKPARDDAYFARLAEGPAGAQLVKLADRLDNLRDVLRASWPEEKKRGYAAEALERIIPAARERWPDEAAAVEREALCLLEALDRGEGDVPDVGPHQGDSTAISEEDPELRLSPHLSFFARGEEHFLYHDLIGDIIQMHPKVLGFLDYFAAPRRVSAAREAFKEEFLPGDLDAFFDTLTQHLVLLGREGEDLAVTRDWHPLRGPWIVSHAPPGGPVTLCYKDRREGEVVKETLSPLLGRLFALCDGSLPVSALVRRLAKELPQEQDVEQRVRDALRRWTHSERQLLKLLPRPRSAYDMPGVGLPPYAQSTMPYPRVRRGAPPPPDADLRHYHKLEIDSAREQFELKETTLSHALRIPHPALGGRPYGVALGHALLARDVLPTSDEERIGKRFQIVEVGGGTGLVAGALLDALALRAPRLFNRLRYAIVDLSPALSAHQRAANERHRERLRNLTGDAERLPLADASVDFLLSNEVIADLAVTMVRRIDVDGSSGEDGGPGAQAVRRYGIPIDDAPGLFSLNLGAIRFLEEIARVLRPGGTALLTEYGDQGRYAEASTHLDHPEFSIHFGHLQAVASALGLEQTLETVPNLLGLEDGVEVLHTTQSFFETLRAFLADRGVALEKLAYTPAMFDELLGGKLQRAHLQGLAFGPIGSRVLGLKPYEFKALLLRKPRRARAKKRVAVDL